MSRPIDPELLDERLRLTLQDMCRMCGVHAEFLMELVEEGIITPTPARRQQAPQRSAAPQRPAMPRRRQRPRAAHAWQFDGIAVVRVQRAVRLQQDLGVNLPGVALALELLDELEALRGNR